MSDTPWTPEQMRKAAEAANVDIHEAEASGDATELSRLSVKFEAMLRQGAADREDNARLRERVRALEVEVARLKEDARDHECPSFGMCRHHATTAIPESCLYCDLATLTAEHERLKASTEQS